MKIICKNCGNEIVYRYKIFRYNGSFVCNECGRKYNINDVKFNIHEKALVSFPVVMSGGIIGLGISDGILTSRLLIFILIVILIIVADFIQYKFIVRSIEKYGLKD